MQNNCLIYSLTCIFSISLKVWGVYVSPSECVDEVLNCGLLARTNPSDLWEVAKHSSVPTPGV